MRNDINVQKTVEQLKKNLHAVANNPPKTDPFSGTGRTAWEEWAEACRGFEAELRSCGEVF